MVERGMISDRAYCIGMANLLGKFNPEKLNILENRDEKTAVRKLELKRKALDAGYTQTEADGRLNHFLNLG